MIAKILLPEDPVRVNQMNRITIDQKGNNKNLIEAITNGAMDGAQAMIVRFVLSF